MSRQSSSSPGPSISHASRPFSPSPPRDNRHTISKPPSLLFGAPPVGIVAPSNSFSISGLPPTPSPPGDIDAPKDSSIEKSGNKSSAGDGFFDGSHSKLNGKSSWNENLIENEAEWIKSGGGMRRDGTVEGEFIHSRHVSSKFGESSESASSSSSASPPLGATSLLAALAGASSPPRSSSPSSLVSPEVPVGEHLPSNEPTFSSLFDARLNANLNTLPVESIQQVAARRTVRSSTIDHPSPKAWDASKLPRLHQPTVVRSTSGRGLAFLPPPARPSPSGSTFRHSASDELASGHRRQSSASHHLRTPSGAKHPRSVSLAAGDGSPSKSSIPRPVSRINQNGTGTVSAPHSPTLRQLASMAGGEERQISSLEVEMEPENPERGMKQTTSGPNGDDLHVNGQDHAKDKTSKRVPDSSRLPRWKSPGFERRKGSYILSVPVAKDSSEESGEVVSLSQAETKDFFVANLDQAAVSAAGLSIVGCANQWDQAGQWIGAGPKPAEQAHDVSSDSVALPATHTSQASIFKVLQNDVPSSPLDDSQQRDLMVAEKDKSDIGVRKDTTIVNEQHPSGDINTPYQEERPGPNKHSTSGPRSSADADKFITPSDADEIPAHQIAKRYESANDGQSESTLHEVIERSLPSGSVTDGHDFPSQTSSSPFTAASDDIRYPYEVRKKRNHNASYGSKSSTTTGVGPAVDRPLNSTTPPSSVRSDRNNPNSNDSDNNAIAISMFAGLTRHRTSPLPISAPHLELQVVWPDKDSLLYDQQWFKWVPGRRYIPSWGLRFTL